MTYTFQDANHARMVVWQCLLAFDRMVRTDFLRHPEVYSELRRRKYYARLWLRSHCSLGGWASEDIKCGIRLPGGRLSPIPPPSESQ